MYSVVIIRYGYHKLLFMSRKLEFSIGKKVCLYRHCKNCIREAHVEGNTEVVLVTRRKSINKMEDLDVEG